MRTVFDDYNPGRGVADELLGPEVYRQIRAVATGIEEVKHLAQYMPQLYRLFELTKNLGELITTIEGAIPVRVLFSAEQNNLVNGQTAFVIDGGYIPGQILVFKNGEILSNNDYIALNGTTVVLDVAVTASDKIDIVANRSRLLQGTEAFELSLASLPTALPAASGVPWNNGGVLSIS